MPRRNDIQSILIIGAGPIVIGQACEFDYSGTQAVKTLRGEGYRVILVNSNPATIMTDPEIADATYIEPITPDMVEKIIAKERPDALLPTMGGQTALNCAKALAESGVLEKYKVEMIGAKLDAINKAENRELFNAAMEKIGLEVAKSGIAHNLAEAHAVLKKTNLPAVIRPSFTMGGTGGGIAYTMEEFERIVTSGLDASPTTEVLIDESLLGWKEYEMEVVRDRVDNCIIVCSIENIDPMGVHTGDSITVAPALTLTDKEYQIMRDASLAVLREIGVDTGGSNVQFAVNPKNGRMVVIEMNPRVSRSSALASKATGFPIAKVAAKLAVGYTLDEVANDVVAEESRVESRESSKRDSLHDSNRSTLATPFMPASFEPTLDYIVTKIPRFAFEKFPGTDPLLTTAMKSVGEAMAMGRNFAESLQKALRSLETGLTGLNETDITDISVMREMLAKPTPDRILNIAQALRLGIDRQEIHAITSYDPWFIAQLEAIVREEEVIRTFGSPLAGEHASLTKASGGGTDPHSKTSPTPHPTLPRKGGGLSAVSQDNVKANLLRWKRMGFSDARIGELTGKTAAEIQTFRWQHGIRPVYKRVDTCAGEFEALTPYMYSTYENSFEGASIASGESPPPRSPSKGSLTLPVNPSCEADVSDRRKVIILGGGPNRIGQGIEFDYCCVHAAYALKEIGIETIMVNCNPETVSTDYDTSDRLYFEPLTAEDVIEIAKLEQSKGALLGLIVQFGGQTPLKLAHALETAGIPIIGTSPDMIDLAEDRERFQQLLHRLDLLQPANAICRSVEEVILQASQIGYPVVVRPSYVLGGRAMAIIHDAETLKNYTSELVKSFGDGPILLDSYLQDAIEVDVDALSDGTDVHIAGILEHIEEAGIHSGDSACSLPAYSLPKSIREDIRAQTVKLALALNVVGLMNVQFAVKKEESRVESRESSKNNSDSNHSTLATHKIYILEANPRASRTVPFVAKAMGVQIAKLAARLMAGERLQDLNLNFGSVSDPSEGERSGGDLAQPMLAPLKQTHIAVKEAVFPFARFANVDTILGPEMKSTGEAMGIDTDFPKAFAKAQMAAGTTLPISGQVFISVKEGDKPSILSVAKQLTELGFSIIATHGTAEYFNSRGVAAQGINKVREGSPHIVDVMKRNEIALVFNTTEGAQSIADSFSIRRTALLQKIPYSTTIAGSRAIAGAIAALKTTGLEVRSLQEYFA